MCFTGLNPKSGVARHQRVTLDAVLSQCPWQYHFDSSCFMVLEAYSLPFSGLCPAVPECPYYTYFDLSRDQNESFNNRELV